MNCICGAGSPTPLRCNRWKPRPGRRSNRSKWKGELEHRQQGWGGREKWHQTAQGEQAAVPVGQQSVMWVSLRQGHEPSHIHKVYVWPYGSDLQGWTQDILQQDCKRYSSGLDLCPCSLLSCLQSWELQGNVQVKAQWAHVWWCTPGEGFSWLLSARTWFMCWTMGWLGVREKPSQGSMCVHCEERRGDWETSCRQGKRISNSVGLLPLAAGCFWFKKLCCLSLIFVPCLHSLSALVFTPPWLALWQK